MVFVDLAGNESSVGATLSRPTPAQRKQIAEQKEINKSLFALKECIRALHTRGGMRGGMSSAAATGSSVSAGRKAVAPKTSHIAFRGSRLTMVLKEHLMGDRSSHAVMIANVSPNAAHAARTADTLAYAALVASSG